MTTETTQRTRRTQRKYRYVLFFVSLVSFVSFVLTQSPTRAQEQDEITRLLVEKLLLEPTEQLKALPDEETQAVFAEALNRLFRLRDDAGGSSHSPESITSTKPRK